MSTLSVLSLLALLGQASAAPCCASCPAGRAQYWALDTPNNECAETCLNPSSKIELAEFWVLTGGKGQPSGQSSQPCKDNGFRSYNRTDALPGLKLDKYSPDAEGAPRCWQGSAVVVDVPGPAGFG